MKRNNIYVLPLLIALILISSCKKGYLDVKPDQSLLVPSTLKDMQAILDNTNIMNNGPSLHALATDDYEISSANLNTLSTAAERNTYVWADDIYEGEDAYDWNLLYQQIFYANVVLDALNKIGINDANQTEWNRLKGSALFYRAHALYQLADEFAVPYNETSSTSMINIPVKLSSDVNERPARGSLGQLYGKIINDLNDAVNLLPVKQAWLNRPGKLATWALLSRIHLSMGEYRKSQDYADKYIDLSPSLLDFNTLSTTSTRPIAARGIEVIYTHFMSTYDYWILTSTSISPSLVSSYDTNDLRKIIFIRDRGNNIFTFKGNYSGTSTIFSGISTNEIYLNRAECRARLNDVEGALVDLNTLMQKRWSNKVVYKTIIADSSEDALKKILFERRKELITRGTRWADLRRLNQDTRFSITIKRTINGKEHVLSPNDIKYIFPRPESEKNN